MKIYFSGSIRGGRNDKKLYFQIINHLKKYGKVLTEHVGDARLSTSGQTEFTDEQIYNRDVSWIKEADAAVLEVSTPSLGVGYEACLAEQLNKKILGICRMKRGKKLSAMISGNKNLVIRSYKNTKEALKHIDDFFLKSKV